MRMYDYQTMIGLKQQEVEKSAESAWKYVKNSKKQLQVDTADGKQSLRKRLENLLGLSN
ncbi:hypothetical protein SAMN05444673_4164 [Bacillus sp. OV166]|uniref:hypothetical protein n=1 Tax=Bacillus sp. OV166 TaxID=1882763 RepID=UPI000A2AB317|nr:hypothetical protein [Bacillus sp. OV166]SMQ81156.1 hypothetical protein SAMN05444673_4164 [Bacillus sp. OV166]